MRIKMLTTTANPSGITCAGEIWQADPATATQLIANGFAVAVDPMPQRQTATAPGAPATAAVAPPEQRTRGKSSAKRSA